MNRDDVLAVLNKPGSLKLMRSDVHARLAYNGPDGFPRVVPMGYLWTGQEIVVCSPPNATKVRSLQRDSKVALTIDTDAFPPEMLLIRGTAVIEIVDGVPDDFIEGSRRFVPEDGFAEWEENVRGLYDQMARIIITPTWAKLIDFQTTLPSAIEELIAAKSGAGPAHEG